MTHRTFDVVFGVHGQDQVVLLADKPVWEARQFAMRALHSEAGTFPQVADTLNAVALRLQSAELGSILFGHVEQYEGADGRSMFIALLPTGMDYRDAGQKSPAFSRMMGRPLFTPTPVE